MEDALVHGSHDDDANDGSLNPCFNGRCTRTSGQDYLVMSHNLAVLILVLMEDALVQGKFKRMAAYKEVLILVLMEDALVLSEISDFEGVQFVLILVLMEDALVQQNLGNALFKRIVRLNCASKDLYLTNFMYLFSECKSSYFYGEAQNFYVKISAKHIKC